MMRIIIIIIICMIIGVWRCGVCCVWARNGSLVMIDTCYIVVMIVMMIMVLLLMLIVVLVLVLIVMLVLCVLMVFLFDA